jgi:TatD DNase family protein
MPSLSSSDTSNIENIKLRFVDIGANLLDERFTHGIYHGKQRHESDWDQVIQRAAQIGVTHIILTAGTLLESRHAVQQVRKLRLEQQDERETLPRIHFSCTVGVHPTRCLEFQQDGVDPEEHVADLLEVARDGMSDESVVAVGEMGLDYDRLEFCPKEVQLRYFALQLQGLAKPTGLPLFLHNRNVGTDLYDLLQAHRDCWTAGGVVHSFDDSLDLANQFISNLGLYIGLNGCSLRTQQNLEVAKSLPLERILLETDCPYCDIKRTHAGYHFVQNTFESRDEKKFQSGMMVKGRNEPCQIIQVAQVVAGARGMPVEQVADACYANTMNLYKFRNDAIERL